MWYDMFDHVTHHVTHHVTCLLCGVMFSEPHGEVCGEREELTGVGLVACASLLGGVCPQSESSPPLAPPLLRNLVLVPLMVTDCVASSTYKYKTTFCYECLTHTIVFILYRQI